MKSNLWVCGLAAFAVAGILANCTPAPKATDTQKSVPADSSKALDASVPRTKAASFKCRASDPTTINGKACRKQCNQAKDHGGMHMDDDFHSW